jgi:hypothetical protein
MLTTLVSIFLIITLIIQIIAMLYLIITTIKRDREDKKFWDNIHKEIEESNRKCLKLMEDTCYPTWESEQIENKK